MRSVLLVFVLALITIAYATLTSAEVSHTATPDPVTSGYRPGLKRG